VGGMWKGTCGSAVRREIRESGFSMWLGRGYIDNLGAGR
jgi:hypothetical protein